MLYKLAGPKTFVEIARVSLKAIREGCGEETLGAVSTVIACGARPLSVVRS